MEERSLQRFVWIFLVCVVSVSVFQITTSCKPGAVEITPENIVGKEGQNTAITCCFSVITSPTWLINGSRQRVKTALENKGSCYCQTLNLTLKRNYDKTTVQCTINSGTTRSGILMIKLFKTIGPVHDFTAIHSKNDDFPILLCWIPPQSVVHIQEYILKVCIQSNFCQTGRAVAKNDSECYSISEFHGLESISKTQYKVSIAAWSEDYGVGQFSEEQLLRVNSHSRFLFQSIEFNHTLDQNSGHFMLNISWMVAYAAADYYLTLSCHMNNGDFTLQAVTKLQYITFYGDILQLYSMCSMSLKACLTINCRWDLFGVYNFTAIVEDNSGLKSNTSFCPGFNYSHLDSKPQNDPSSLQFIIIGFMASLILILFGLVLICFCFMIKIKYCQVKKNISIVASHVQNRGDTSEEVNEATPSNLYETLPYLNAGMPSVNEPATCQQSEEEGYVVMKKAALKGESNKRLSTRSRDDETVAIKGDKSGMEEEGGYVIMKGLPGCTDVEEKTSMQAEDKRLEEKEGREVLKNLPGVNFDNGIHS